jgi:hypothetical protein
VPESYTIDPGLRLVISRAWGLFTNEELITHYQRLRTDPAFDPSFRQLVDLRAVQALDMAPVTLETVAQLRVFAPGSRRVLLTSSLPQYGAARRFARYAEAVDQEIRVLYDAESAEAWLDA